MIDHVARVHEALEKDGSEEENKGGCTITLDKRDPQETQRWADLSCWENEEETED